MRRAALAIGAAAAGLVLSGCASALAALDGGGGAQATASCAVAGWPDPRVDVTFTNPTGQAIQPSWVAVVTFGADGGQDWSDSDWMPRGYLLGGYIVAAGQTVTYAGGFRETPPADAVTCKVASWQAD